MAFSTLGRQSLQKPLLHAGFNRTSELYSGLVLFWVANEPCGPRVFSPTGDHGTLTASGGTATQAVSAGGFGIRLSTGGLIMNGVLRNLPRVTIAMQTCLNAFTASQNYRLGGFQDGIGSGAVDKTLQIDGATNKFDFYVFAGGAFHATGTTTPTVGRT